VFNWHRLKNNLVLNLNPIFYSGENLLEKSPAHINLFQIPASIIIQSTLAKISIMRAIGMRSAYGSQAAAHQQKRPTNARRISQTISSQSHFL
jgi:hypothetical protein